MPVGPAGRAGASSTNGLYILLYDTSCTAPDGRRAPVPQAPIPRRRGTAVELVQIWSLTPTVQIWFNRPQGKTPIGRDVDLWRFTGWWFQERSITLAAGSTVGATGRPQREPTAPGRHRR